MPIYIGNVGNGGTSGSSYVPGVIGLKNDINLLKDTYEVFVNKDKVGEKVLLTQTDNPEDLEKYLKEQGFNDFKVEIVGGQINIEAQKDSEQMKEILSSYLSIK